jgi:hypothetical protein
MARNRGDSAQTADILVARVRDYILFHNKRHPAELGLREVTHFLEHVVKSAADPRPGITAPGGSVHLYLSMSSRKTSTA